MMKKLLIAFAFLPLFAWGQTDSCALIETVDTYTKEKVISTGFLKLKDAAITIDAKKDEVDIFLAYTGRNRCVSDKTTAVIFFANSKMRMNQRNNGSMNCEGNIHFLFRNLATPPVLLRRMASMPIDRIVLNANTKDEVIISLKEEEQQKLMAIASCMEKAAPTLIK